MYSSIDYGVATAAGVDPLALAFAQLGSGNRWSSGSQSVIITFVNATNTGTVEHIRSDVSRADIVLAITDVHERLMRTSVALDDQARSVLYSTLWDLYQ